MTQNPPLFNDTSLSHAGFKLKTDSFPFLTLKRSLFLHISQLKDYFSSQYGCLSYPLTKLFVRRIVIKHFLVPTLKSAKLYVSPSALTILPNFVFLQHNSCPIYRSQISRFSLFCGPFFNRLSYFSNSANSCRLQPALTKNRIQPYWQDQSGFIVTKMKIKLIFKRV